MKRSYLIVCCVYSLESPHRGGSNEYTQYTILTRRSNKKTPKLSPFASWPGAVINPERLELQYREQISMIPKGFVLLRFCSLFVYPLCSVIVALLVHLLHYFDYCVKYSRTPVARTSMWPWKLVRDMSSSSYWGLSTALGQEANGDNLGKSFRSSTQ